MRMFRLMRYRCFGIACSTVMVVTLSVTLAQAQSQESQNQNLQQLTDKVQQLEQELQALKQQIGALEKAPAQQAPAAPQAPATAPAPQAATAPAAQAPGVPAAQLESTGQEPSERTEPADKPRTIDLYGFVMLDSGYQFGQNDPNWFDVVRPTKLPAFPNEFAPSGKFFFGVRQTRFGVKTTNPTRFGDLKTTFEFELFGVGVNAGQTTFRLRHAYGELGHFGAGQTWSPFMDPDVFPNSLEYWGPNGMVFFRNLQFRYMPIKNDRLQITFAAENPGATADQGTFADRVELQNIKPKFDMPDFSWQARVMRDWGHLQVAGIFRKITWVDTNPAAAVHLGDTVLGWGVNVSSNVKFTKNDLGRFQVVYGKGIENYMNDAPIDIGVKSNLINPIRPVLGVPLPVLGVVAFLDHNWSERFSSTAGYSMVDIQNSNAQLPSDYHQGHYALTNLLFHPVKPVTVGGEFQYGRRVNFRDGFNFNDYRVQFSFKYDWKKLVQY